METFIDQLDIVPRAYQPDVLVCHFRRLASEFMSKVKSLAAHDGLRTLGDPTNYIDNRTLLQTESKKIEIELRKSLNPKPEPVLRSHCREPDSK